MAKPVRKLQYVEDVLTVLMFCSEDFFWGDKWNAEFVESVYTWTERNNALTTAQANHILTILKTLRNQLVSSELVIDSEIDRLLASPTYRNQPTPSTHYPREVRHLGNSLLGFRFKRQNGIVAIIKRHGGEWDWYSKIWVMELSPSSVDDMVTMIGSYQFKYDDSVLRLLTDVSNFPDTNSATLEDNHIVVTTKHKLLDTWVLTL